MRLMAERLSNTATKGKMIAGRFQTESRETMMTVAELIAALRGADPASRVLFLGEYADCDEGDEIREVVIPQDAWTYDSGRYAGREYAVRYPGPPAQREDTGYTDVTQVPERVVVLSTGPTNLRFDPNMAGQLSD
jgi:hypothetical protein